MMVDPGAGATIVLAGYALQPSRTVLVQWKPVDRGVVDVVIGSELTAAALVFGYNYGRSAITSTSIDGTSLAARSLTSDAPCPSLAGGKLKTGSGCNRRRSGRGNPYLCRG